MKKMLIIEDDKIVGNIYRRKFQIEGFDVELAPDGQIIVDTSRLYQWPKGQPSKFNDPGAFLPA